MTWGDTFRKCLARGDDHGAAAFSADMAEKRKKTEAHQKIASEARDIERQKCINIIEGLLVKQRENNHHHPSHAEAYPQWQGRVLGLEAALNALKQKEAAQ